MIQIVLAKVVLGQIRNIRKLHVRNILGAKYTDIHLCFLLSYPSNAQFFLCFLALSIAKLLLVLPFGHNTRRRGSWR